MHSNDAFQWNLNSSRIFQLAKIKKMQLKKNNFKAE